MIRVTEDLFVQLLKPILSRTTWSRTTVIFRNYGARLAWDVAGVLWHTRKQNKVLMVLRAMEKHWDIYLRGRRPNLRGISLEGVPEDPTQKMFDELFGKVLGLKMA